jgi:hypothetical protein
VGVGGGVGRQVVDGAADRAIDRAAVALASKLMVERTISPSLERGTAPGKLDVAVADLERLLGRPATDLKTAGERAPT